MLEKQVKVIGIFKIKHTACLWSLSLVENISYPTFKSSITKEQRGGKNHYDTLLFIFVFCNKIQKMMNSILLILFDRTGIYIHIQANMLEKVVHKSFFTLNSISSIS